jgi:hypothetical protein
VRARLGFTLGAPALLLTLIHRSASKENARKSIYRMLHSPGPMRYASATGVGRIFLIIPVGAALPPQRSWPVWIGGKELIPELHGGSLLGSKLVHEEGPGRKCPGPQKPAED